MERILGLHHITAISGSARRNYDFYTSVLGLRLVKKTVNFDDPFTYHLYYGDEAGSPGTILTFFPWEKARKGINGTGIASETLFSIPADSFGFWVDHLNKKAVRINSVGTRFGEPYISFQDPDGLTNVLIVSSKKDERNSWETSLIRKESGIKGFQGINLTLKELAPTSQILESIFGYTLIAQEHNKYRFVTDAIETASVIDICEDSNQSPAINAVGTIHHVAFRVKDEVALMNFRTKIKEAGLTVTTKIDRNYFYSIYFREPGGVLFELATDNPGFSIDELPDELGSQLKLPRQHESMRHEIEESLPDLVTVP